MAISTESYYVNEEIRVPKVRVIGADGTNLGVLPTEKALQLAREANLDLVEVAPEADPPVCRILDYGKFIFERTKKEREARKAQTRVEIKEIQLRPKTTEHHREFKVRDARRWLSDGLKVRVAVRFRGREITYPELAVEDLKEVAASLADVSVVEQQPGMDGRTMVMVLAPLHAQKKKVAAQQGASAVAEGEVPPQH